MIRIIRLLNAKKVLNEFANDVLNPQINEVLRLLRVLALTLTVAHLGGCFFHFLGAYDGEYHLDGWLI